MACDGGLGGLLQHVSAICKELLRPSVMLTLSSRWEQNEMMINQSCDALGYSGVPNPTSEELDGILDAISAESKESGLDERFLLAVIVSPISPQTDF